MPQLEVPKSIDEVDSAWVAEVLRQNGFDLASVPEICVEPLEAQNSSVARVHFSGDRAQGQLPATMFLKLCAPGHDFLGGSEPAWYGRDYAGLRDAPIVQCYASVGPENMKVADTLGEGYALLLADLTDSHTDNKHVKSTPKHAEHLGRALGRLHAHRWGPEADPDGPHDLEADFDRYVAHVARGLGPILDAVGDGLEAADRDRLQRVFDEDAVRLRHRIQRGVGITLIHGDPNPTNVLTLRSTTGQDAGDQLYLIDRQPFGWGLRLWFGAYDLVYAAVPFSGIDARRANETGMLRSYHAALVEGGVQGYDQDDLIEDWRACLCHAAMVAVEWGSDPVSLKDMRWLWERQLERALAVLRDW